MKYAFLILLVFLSLSACGQDPLEPDEAEIEWTYTDTLTVAHWNIGHFALGRSNDTTIPGEKADSMARLYHAMLDTLDVDILGICEYNSFFDKSGGSTRSLFFGDFPYFEMGDKFSYNFNAIFSRIKLYNAQNVIFDKCVQTRYFIETTLKINDHDVKFVETHLDWNEGVNGAAFRAEQIRQLINTYAKEPYVIICADYNTEQGMEEFRPFTDVGFSLANSGDLLTYPTIKPRSPIDNIILRGFRLFSSDMIRDSELSDHSLICCKIVFI